MTRKLEKVKGTFDEKTRLRIFRKGNIVLMWNERDEKLEKHGKFDSLWLDPCYI